MNKIYPNPLSIDLICKKNAFIGNTEIEKRNEQIKWIGHFSLYGSVR